MAEQYWIGGFFIDLSRNQITQNNQSKTLAPKALAVLTHLAEHQGQVVSHEALLAKVWQGTVVSPNSLQRSIAQLRKALGDDGKVQVYIKTHAKQGYSLECDVRWHDGVGKKVFEVITKESVTNEAADSEIAANVVKDSAADEEVNSSELPTGAVAESKPLKSRTRLIALIFGIMILAAISYQFTAPKQPETLSIGALRSLTTTDNKEHSGIYSPNGEYIVFNRYSDEHCASSNIWAKNIKTQKEMQLTNNIGRYGSHSFSKDGKKLVFINIENCDKPINQKDCYKLMTLDFDKALKSPQAPSLLMECKNSIITKSKWLKNNNIALLQQLANHWKLISYSIEDNKSTDIYSLAGGQVIDYDYSAKDDIIALISVHNDGQNYIEIIKSTGQLLSSYPIEYPPEITNLSYIYPNFSPLDNQLVFSTGRQLFTLSYQGKIAKVSLPLDEPAGSPTFHPDGKRALMIKGHWDSDIATFSLSKVTNSNSTEIAATHSLTEKNGDVLPIAKIISRSTREEDSAIFQPNGKLIAFKSDRSGEDQIWLNDDNELRQLTNFSIDAQISGLDWAADGKSILVNANNVLVQVNLDAKQKSFPIAFPVAQLFHWDSDNNSALLLIRIKGILKFVEFNMNDLSFKIITDKKVNWALKSEDGRLIYTDHMDRFWQPGPAEDQMIEVLEHQGSDKRYIVKHNVIYGINEGYQLWSYALNDGTFKVLGNIPVKIDFITDINQNELLMTTRVSAKKEVAELTLSE